MLEKVVEAHLGQPLREQKSTAGRSVTSGMSHEAALGLQTWNKATLEMGEVTEETRGQTKDHVCRCKW